MNAHKIWANLPVQDIERTRRFFMELGFRLNPCHGGDQLVSFLVGDDDFVVHFFAAGTFGKAVKAPIADLGKGHEVLFTLSADSRAEVDEAARAVKAAGGTVFAEPEEAQGTLYGCGFADPDGHRWNVLFRESKPKA